jgi:tRNA dimethylallyltransferase
LWVRALLHGLVDAPPADPAVRERHRSIAETEGRSRLHTLLALVDPESARRLAPNDFVRVSRALEVHELTGTKLSAIQERHGFSPVRHRARLIGLRRTADELDERIAARARSMIAAGLIEEVERLLKAGYGGSRAMGSVGYRQVRDALATGGAIDHAELTEAIRRATRVFARRQRTWLRREPVEWLDPENALETLLSSLEV